MSANARVIKDPDVVNYSHFGAGNTYIALKEKDNTKLFGANSSNNAGDNEDITTGDILAALRGLMLTYVGTCLTLSLVLGSQNNTMCSLGILGAQATADGKSAEARGMLIGGAIGCGMGAIGLLGGLGGAYVAGAKAAEISEASSIPIADMNAATEGATGQGIMSGEAGAAATTAAEIPADATLLQTTANTATDGTEQVAADTVERTPVLPKPGESVEMKDLSSDADPSARSTGIRNPEGAASYKTTQDRQIAIDDINNKYAGKEKIINGITGVASSAYSATQMAQSSYTNKSGAKQKEATVYSTLNQTEGTNLKFTENNVNSASQNQNAAAQVVDHVNSAKIASSSNIR